METILSLAHGNTSEEKIASVLMTVKYFEKIGDSCIQNSNFLHDLILGVTPIFLIRMLASNNILLKNSSMQLFQHFFDDVTIISLFKSNLNRIIDVALSDSTTDSSVLYILKIFTLKCSAIEETVGYSLEISHKMHAENFVCYLDFLSLLLSQAATPIVLTPSQSLRLRDILTQCLHGAAVESSRDLVFNTILILLTSLDPSWMLASVGGELYVNMGEDGTRRKVEENFPRILTSIVCGELRIAIDEYCDILLLMWSTLSTVATVSPDSGASDISQQLSNPRYTRIHLLCPICLKIIDEILYLLIGKEESCVTEHDVEESSGCWSHLDAKTLLFLKTEVSDVISLMFEAVSCSTMSVISHRENCVANKSMLLVHEHLRVFIARCMRCAVGWVLEDDNLHKHFTQCLPVLLNFSTLPKDGREALSIRVQNIDKYKCMWLLSFNDPIDGLGSNGSNGSNGSDDSDGSTDEDVILCIIMCIYKIGCDEILEKSGADKKRLASVLAPRLYAVLLVVAHKFSICPNVDLSIFLIVNSVLNTMQEYLSLEVSLNLKIGLERDDIASANMLLKYVYENERCRNDVEEVVHMYL